MTDAKCPQRAGPKYVLSTLWPKLGVLTSFGLGVILGQHSADSGNRVVEAVSWGWGAS